jgi:Predicted membrane protein
MLTEAEQLVLLCRQSHSQIMSTYYVFLWAVEALNVLRILLQIGSTEASHPALWNSLWIGTRFGLELLEVSVVVFLLQGYLRTGREVRAL